MKLVDLHIHSSYSDGIFQPEYIVDKIYLNSIPGFSITDHDSFEAIDIVINYLKKKKFNRNILFIPGCEFSSYDKNIGEIHIIGYFKNNDYKKVENFTKEFQTYRLNRAKNIINCLKKNGYEISEDEIIQSEKKAIGRLNIARELVKKGFFPSISEAFEKMLRSGTPCYFKKKEETPEKIIEIIKEHNGNAVIAHPTFLSNLNDWNFLKNWKKIGLWGIECYHPKISESFAKKIIENLKDDFAITGGSDFHGDDKNLEIGQYGILIEKAMEILA